MIFFKIHEYNLNTPVKKYIEKIVELATFFGGFEIWFWQVPKIHVHNVVMLTHIDELYQGVSQVIL